MQKMFKDKEECDVPVVLAHFQVAIVFTETIQKFGFSIGLCLCFAVS